MMPVNRAVFLGSALLMLVAVSAQTPRPGATDPPPVRCARPNVPAMVLNAVTPDTPPIAQQQGISGTVQVVVSLDPTSRVVGTRIMSSPSAILNQAALAAARASTFQTEIYECRPIAADYIYTVSFNSQPGRMTTAEGKPAIVVDSIATVTRPADIAYVNTTIRGPAAANPGDAEPPSADLTALRAKLSALGIRPEDITESGQIMRFFGRPMVVPTPQPTGAPSTAPAPSYASYRNLRIVVGSLRELPAVQAAIRAVPGNTGGNVQYGLRDREPAYREAVARAVRDARARAETAAKAAGVQLGAVQQLSVQPPDPDPVPGQAVFALSDAGDSANQPTITIRARVMATYLIAR
jgi:uncharacterized protein